MAYYLRARYPADLPIDNAVTYTKFHPNAQCSHIRGYRLSLFRAVFMTEARLFGPYLRPRRGFPVGMINLAVALKI